MSLPTLYSYRRCPYAIRARLALSVASVAVDLHEITLRNKPAQMLAASPKGTVPVLVLPDGQVIEQSLDIMAWALRQHDPEGWLPQGIDEATTAALIATNVGPFKALLDSYKYAERHPLPRATYRDQAVEIHLGPLNQRLLFTPCLLGQTPTLVDMAIVPFVRQFALVDAAWFEASPLTALSAWLRRLSTTALFNAVMLKPPSDLWRRGRLAHR